MTNAQNARAAFSRLSWTFEPNQANPAPDLSPGSLNVNVRIRPTSSSISGEGLWAMDFYASTNQQGTGPRYFLKEQILS